MTYQSVRFRVSVKGVVVQAGRVLLLRNERQEWELPGGKLERGEEPAQCVQREVAEESGWRVTAGPLLDAWQYQVTEHEHVLILTYGCHLVGVPGPVVVSTEHSLARLFTAEEVHGARIPDGYKRSIAAWYQRLGGLGRE